MNNMIVLCGKTASGKTRVRDELVKRGFKSIVTYTTRPKRRGEKNGESYFFVSDSAFDQMVADDAFAEYKEYTVSGGSLWRYGCTKESITNADDNSIIILTPGGYKDVRKFLPENHICIYLYANMETIRKRLKKRRDKNDDIERRIKNDNRDFKGFQNVDGVKVVYNNVEPISEVVDKIICMSSD